MYQCDIHHALSAIQKHLPGISQDRLFTKVFEAAIEDRSKLSGDAYYPDPGDISKIFSGYKYLPKWMIAYYHETGIQTLISPVSKLCSTMYTIDTLVDELYLHVQADPILGVDAKQRIIANYPYALREEKITFISACLHAAILRPQQLIPISDARLRVDHIYGARIPKPCQHFQGREKELQQLHELLEQNNVVYLWGDDGMGKSQLALAYAAQYPSDTAVYLPFNENWRKTLSGKWILGDELDLFEESRAEHHEHLLRKLPSDALLIVDNANIPESEDGEMEKSLQHIRCKVIITSRCRHQEACEYHVDTLPNIALLALVRHFFAFAPTEERHIHRMIQLVHQHTYLVELLGRFLGMGALTPAALARRLALHNVRLDCSNPIRSKKDNQLTRQTYYHHLHYLYSLFTLNSCAQLTLARIWLMPEYQAQLSAGCHWFSDDFAFDADLLQECGYIQIQDDIISMAPMMRDMIGAELVRKPNISFQLRKQLEDLCLDSAPKSFPELFCVLVERAAKYLPAESPQQQLLFLENIFHTFEDSNYISGMEFVLIQMSAMLEAPAPTPSADLALLWDYRAAYFHITSPQNSDAVKYAHEKALDVLPLPPQNSADAEIIVNVLNNVAVNLCHRNNYEGAYQIHKRIRILRDQFPPTGYSQSLSAQNCNFIMACVKSGHTNEAQATLSPTEHKILESAGLHSTDYLQFLLAKSVLLACISDDLQCAVTVSTFCHLLPAVFPDDDRIQNQYLHALRQELAPYRSCSSRYGLLLPDQY